jgi:O-antigen ligase
MSRFLKRYAFVVPLLAGVPLISLFCANERYSDAVAIAFVTVTLTFAIRAVQSTSSAGFNAYEIALLIWFIVSPIASYYLRLPAERAIITFDRIILAALVVIFVLRDVGSSEKSFTVTRFEIAWGVLALTALISVVIKSNNFGFAARVAVDSLALPLAVFFFTRRLVNPEACAKPLVGAAIVVALLLFGTGAYETITGDNLFAFKGSELIRAGERRVNGPFSTDSSFATIALMMAVFLRAAPRMFRVKLDAGGRLLCVAAILAAVAAALMPMFRSVIIAGIMSAVVYEVLAAGVAKSGGARVLAGKLTIAALLGVMLVVAFILWDSPPLTRRLTDPRNLYSRLATWEAASQMTIENPLLGVGLWNFADYFEQFELEDESTLEETLGTRVAVGPHSNLVWVATELGLLGFVPYVVANLCILLAGYGAVRRATDERSRAVAACFTALVIAYWIPGLTLATGAYSDLNLYFFFFLGVLSRLMIAHNR